MDNEILEKVNEINRQLRSKIGIVIVFFVIFNVFMIYNNLFNYYSYDRVESIIISRIYTCSTLKAKQQRYLIYDDFSCPEYTANQWTMEKIK